MIIIAYIQTCSPNNAPTGHNSSLHGVENKASQ